MIDYGCEEFGRLTRVLVHTPTGEELALINEANREHYLFDAVPNVAAYIAEHARYAELLAERGVEVIQLADHVVRHRELMRRLPNLVYLHDVAVVHSRGAILSRMAWPGRAGEEVVVGEALASLGVPLLYNCDGAGAFEGCLLLAERTLFVAETERHSRAAVTRFCACMLAQGFDEVILAEAPKARRYMHPDTLLGRVNDRMFLAYLPALERTWLLTPGGNRREIDLPAFLAERGAELIEVSDSEQKRLACTFVALDPGAILHYSDALAPATRRKLARRGVEVIPFEARALHAGGGSLRCITLRLHRCGEATAGNSAPKG
jgi:arginine deiminase